MGIQTSTINNGPTSGFKNAIINGNFDFWQRRTSQTLSTTSDVSYYVADRWLNYFNGTGGVRTISRQTFTNGQTQVPGNPAYFFRFSQSTAPTGCTFNAITQRIESVRTFAGQQVTFSFWAKAGSAVTLPEVSIGQDFGTGGSPSPQTFAIFSNISISTTWTKYTFTATLPSISGKTLGTDGNHHISVNWFCPTSSTFTLDIAQVQLERGPIATDFEQRPIGTELALCQRYYYAVPGTNKGVCLGTFGYRPLATGATGNYGRNFYFPVTMRAAPLVTISQFGWHPTNTVNTEQTLPNNVFPASVVIFTNPDGLAFTNEYSNSQTITMYAWSITADAEF
jgi:hypothetical protein